MQDSSRLLKKEYHTGVHEGITETLQLISQLAKEAGCHFLSAGITVFNLSATIQWLSNIMHTAVVNV